MGKYDIKINTHSSIRICDSGKVFYFDPFKVEEESHDADYIFITHNHFDHFDIESINKVANEKTVLYTPECMESEVIEAIEKSNSPIIYIYFVGPRKRIVFDDRMSFITLPAYNTDKDFHKKEFGFLSYLMTLNGKRYYIAGDTDNTKEARTIICDVALVPIGGIYTMNYKEAAELINLIKPEIAIPTHYGSVVGEKDLFEKFVSLVDKNIEVNELIK